MGRTRTNKIAVFESDNELIGELVDIQIERANGFSLCGTPVRRNKGTLSARARTHCGGCEHF
jgi:hypothetical protein